MTQNSELEFQKLTSSQFEELCFDLLRQIGFQDMIWRQGGADNGRDIEATWVSGHPILGLQNDKYFVECKNHTNGIDPDDISSKFTWADSENIFALVIITSTYLTNNCRTWLEKRLESVKYKVKIIENKRLIELLESNSNIISKYFISPSNNLALSLENNWNQCRSIPHPSSLHHVLGKSNDKLQSHQIAFLWSISKLFQKDIDKWISDNSPFAVDWMFYELKMMQNVYESPVYAYQCEVLMSDSGISENEICYTKYYAAELHLKNDLFEGIGIYTFVRDSEGEGVELLYLSDASHTFYVNSYQSGAKQEMNGIVKYIESRRIG